MNDELLISRIEKLEKDVETLFKSNSNNSDRLTRIETKIDYMTASIEKMELAIKLLSEKPAKRWDNLVSTIISAVVGVVIGIFFGKVGK